MDYTSKMQICLKAKLNEEPNYLNKYALHIAKSKRINQSKVASVIVNDFEENPEFVRRHLDKKFKNQKMVSKQSALTRLKKAIIKKEDDLSIAKALYESMVNEKK